MLGMLMTTLYWWNGKGKIHIQASPKKIKNNKGYQFSYSSKFAIFTGHILVTSFLGFFHFSFVKFFKYLYDKRIQKNVSYI